MTFKGLAKLVGLSSPSVTERVNKVKDSREIRGFTAVVDFRCFDLNLAAFVRMKAVPGEAKRLAQMLDDTPEVVEAHRLTGEDCFLAKVVVSDAGQLQLVVDRYQAFAAADTAIILSSAVPRRLPKL